MAEAGTPRHHVKIGDFTSQEPRRCFDVAGERDRFRGQSERNGGAVFDRQLKAGPLDYCKGTIDACKLGERPVRPDATMLTRQSKSSSEELAGAAMICVVEPPPFFQSVVRQVLARIILKAETF